MCAQGWPDDFTGFRSGQVIADKYVLLEPLGAGGMGQVWRAQSLATDAEVAVKLLLPTRASSSAVVARFRCEAYATAKLAHRGIVRLFDLVDLPGAVPGSVAMVMERLHGKTLAEHLELQGPLSVAETVSIVLPILSALQHAHAQGIIHRDLKPENIFLAVEPDGEVIPKLLDFGVSKMVTNPARPVTGDGFVVGTPSFMAPEQARGHDVDGRSDIFCVGILLHMCLTGRHPFAAEDSPRAMIAILEAEPKQPPQVSPALWNVIACALEKRPDDRFSTATELADALVAATSSPTPVASVSARTATLPATPLRRRATRQIAGVALAMCTAVLSFGAVSAFTPSAAARIPTRIQREETTRVRTPPRQLLATEDRLHVADESIATASPGSRISSSATPFSVIHIDPRSRSVIHDPGF